MTRRHFDTPLPPEVQFWRLRNRPAMVTAYDQARAAYEKEAKVDQWLMRIQGIRKPLRDRHAAMFRSLTTLDTPRVNQSMPFDIPDRGSWV